jgi:DnaK suppressor protein
MPPTADRPPQEPDLARAERRLRVELVSISAAFAHLTNPPTPRSTLQFGKRFGEGTTEAISRFTDVGVANDLQALKTDVERALEKLDQGSYGVCDSCGEPIPAGRLEVAPASALCIECAQA